MSTGVYPTAPRRAIIVANAAGSPDKAGSALSNAGISATVQVPQLAQAYTQMRIDAFDLLILPLQDLSQAQMAQLEREIRTRPLLSVIGTAPVADPALLLRAMRAGVHEFLVYPPPPDELTNAARRLARRGGEAQVGRVIAVYSAKGGLGVTTIAVNTADAFAASSPPGTVALADCVFTGGDIRVFLNLRPMYHFGDLVTKLSDMDTSMLRSLMTPGPHGMCVVPSAEDPVMDEAFDGTITSTVIGQLRSTFAVTILDCEHHLSERTLAILDSADTILLVTQPNVPALRSTKRTLDLFHRLGYPPEKVHVVLNRFQFGDVFTLRTIADSLGREVYWGLPNDYRIVSGALNKGVSVATEDVTSKLARSFAELAARLRHPNDTVPTTEDGGRASWSRLRRLFAPRGGQADGAPHDNPNHHVA